MWMEGTASDQDCGAADLARTFTAVVWPESGQGQERVRIQAATHDDAEVLLRATYGQGCEFDLTDVQAASRPRTGCDRHGLELPGRAPGGVTQVQEAMVRHLVDLESEFSPGSSRDYDPAELVRFAMGVSDYWAGLGLRWLEQGLPHGELRQDLLALEQQRRRSQPLRHRARRLSRQLRSG